MVLLLVTAVSIIVWLLVRPAEISTATTSTTETTNSSTLAPTSEATGAATETSQYGYISEFGLKYTKTDNQSHLAYSIETLSDGSKAAYFMTSVAAQQCSAHSAGVIIQSSSQIKDVDGVAIRTDQKQIGDYWYAYTPPQSSNCEATMTDSTLAKTIENQSTIVKNEIFASLQLK